MKSSLSPKFHPYFSPLPPPIQQLARKNYKLWKSDPSHPSLKFKRIGKKTEAYSIRIGLDWRVVGVKSDDTIIWFWIGSHADYDRLLKTL